MDSNRHFAFFAVFLYAASGTAAEKANSLAHEMRQPLYAL